MASPGSGEDSVGSNEPSDELIIILIGTLLTVISLASGHWVVALIMIVLVVGTLIYKRQTGGK